MEMMCVNVKMGGLDIQQLEIVTNIFPLKKPGKTLKVIVKILELS